MKIVIALLLASLGAVEGTTQPNEKLSEKKPNEKLSEAQTKEKMASDNLKKKPNEMLSEVQKKEKMASDKRQAAGQMTECLAAAKKLGGKQPVSPEASGLSAKTKEAMAACETAVKTKLGKTADVKGMQREQANDAAKSLMSTCVTDAAKSKTKEAIAVKSKECRTNTGAMKCKIAEAMGKDCKDVKDVDVQKRLRDAGAKEAFLSVQKCDKTTKDKRTACDQAAKTAMANARGMSTMSTFEYKKGVKDMKDKDVGDSLRTCMAEVGSSIASCKAKLAEVIKKGSRDGKVPSSKDVLMAIKDSQKREARDVGATCRDKKATKSSCFSDMKEKLKQTLGKAPSDFEAREMLKAGAEAGAMESFKACFNARKDNPSATCDDPQAVASGMQGGPAPKGDKKGKIDKKKLERKMSTGIMLDGRKSCYTDTDVVLKQCLADATKENKVLLDELNKGKTQSRKDALVKKAERNADTQHFGEVFKVCMEDKAPADSSAKKLAAKACMTELQSAVTLSGGSEPATSMVAKAQSNIFKAISSCDRTNKIELKQCRMNAKAVAKASGVKAREVLRAKKSGEVRAAVEVMSACLDAGNSATDCLLEAKDEFLSVSGSNDLGWSQAVQKKVKALAEADVAGVPTVMRFLKQLTICAQTTDSSCGAEMKAALKAKIVEFGKKKNSAWTTVSTSECRLVDSMAEHCLQVDTPGLTDSQMETHAVELDKDVQTTKATSSSGGRRLATVTVSESGTAQTVNECPETDSTCGTITTSTAMAASTSGGATTASGAPASNVSTPRSAPSSSAWRSATWGLVAITCLAPLA